MRGGPPLTGHRSIPSTYEGRGYPKTILGSSIRPAAISATVLDTEGPRGGTSVTSVL